MQTDNHKILKWKSIEFLYQVMNCLHVIMEMKIGKYIFDTVGCDGSRVFIVEAKQDYSDFKRDCNKPDEILKNVNDYKSAIHETGEIKKYQELIKKEHEKSWKFYDDELLKLTSGRFIIAPSGMIKPEEVPEKWGLISDNLVIEKESPKNAIDKKYAEKIIREISIRQTRYFLEQNGVSFGKSIVFPHYSLSSK